jgi:integrase
MSIQLQSTRRHLAELPKVSAFLESVARNSQETKMAYHSAIVDFQKFLDQKCLPETPETILGNLVSNKTSVYELLEGFISFETKRKLSIRTIRQRLHAMKSFFGYHDIDIVPYKFKRMVRMPKLHREDEEAIDEKDIRKILLACSNRRLKSYLLVLASGGPRAKEALAIRLTDLDFSVKPTKVHIRKEYAKTRVARDIYISDEATQYLKSWIEWKYREGEDKNKDDLVFAVWSKSESPAELYPVVRKEFAKLLELVGFGERKEGMTRRKITLHSLRRFTKSVVETQASDSYSEWLLGHSDKSEYFTKKEPEKREIYATKCMKYLTFLDYITLEATGNSIETKLSEKEKEIQLLRHRDSINTDAIANLSDQVMNLMIEVQELKQQK